MSTTAADIIHRANAAYLSLIRGESDSISQFFSEAYTVHLTERKMSGGHDLVRSVAGKFKSAFSHLSIEVEILMEGAEKVAWQRVFRGTQTGSFFGFPSTGRPVVWRDMVITRFEHEFIAEEWVISDLAERLLMSRKQV